MPIPERSTDHARQVQRWLPGVLGVSALVLGCWAAWVYFDAGLTLSHYDTKGHLVVARRVMDSLTPGWTQLGAVWLPLPHLLNLFPVQIDLFYRTGASAVAISVLAYAVAVFLASRVALQVTGSRAAAVVAAAALALNPDLLYLQATPMTEALLMALLLLALSLTLDWLKDDSPTSLRRAGWATAALCLTRYEAWPFTAAVIAVSVLVWWRQGQRPGEAIRRVSRLAAYPALVIIAFVFHSRLTVGEWFVTGGFFVPDNLDTGQPLRAVASVWWGTHRIAGTPLMAAASVGLVVSTFAGLRWRHRTSLLVLVALIAVGLLPAYAFFEGHPFRIRYTTPLLPALAVYAGMTVGLLPRIWRAAAALVLVGIIGLGARPFNPRAPMRLEAQWDTGNSAARRAITRYLATHHDGRTIMASMGSLAHFMQEASGAGFDLKDFLHEGNGDIWQAALVNPRPHAGWVLIEEWSEGGDQLAHLARENSNFLKGFERVAEGGGVALYKQGG